MIEISCIREGSISFGNPSSKQDKIKQYKDKNLYPLIGSALGVTAGFLATKKIDMRKNHRILDALIHLLAMAGGANIGGVLLGSIGKTKAQKKKKWHEAGFQMMNTTIPMLMVAGTNALCDKFRPNSNWLRIITSGLAMSSGAYIATKITNTTKNENEKNRKYTIKDSLANIDDIVATIAIGFPKLHYLRLETRLMPFIYAYNGMRSGRKE